MIFLADSGFNLGLIALVGGISLLIWSLRNDGKGVSLAKTFGYIVIILSILALICTIYYASSYGLSGYFSSPMGMSGGMQMMKDGAGTGGMMQK